MNVLIIGGGISKEREIALQSAQNVLQAALVHHKAELYDWDGDDQWLMQNHERFDVIFPVLHGEGGEDGKIQQILDSLGAAYVGTDSSHSAVCMDKQKTRELLASQGVLVPQGATVDLEGYKNHELFSKPHVLKPVDGGSSIDTFIFPDVSNRKMDQIINAFSQYKSMLLEEFIKGIEITVPVLDGKEMPVVEIVPPEGGQFDFENKYNGASQEICPPRNVSQELQTVAIQLGKRCHEIMGCRDLSRTDMIIENDKLYVLETNTLPGMTPESLFPKAAKVAGLSMPELVDYLIIRVAQRKKND